MTELVFKSEKGSAVTTSLLVAEKFGKRHSDVLRSIDTIVSQTPELQSKRNFAFSNYIDTTGKSNPLLLAASHQSCLVGEMAKILRQNGVEWVSSDFLSGCVGAAICVLRASGITNPRSGQWNRD